MITRHLQSLILESLNHFPVVLLTGARQVGKSTLAQALIGPSWQAKYFTLDDRRVLNTVLRDPDGFLSANQHPLILDEVQRAPDLMRAIKLIVDRNRRPGLYLLTGSANPLGLKKISESLAGRMAQFELAPFSWAEIKKGKVSGIISDLFQAKSSSDLLKHVSHTTIDNQRSEIIEQILAGGYPPVALMTSSTARQQWFESYIQAYLERDLRNITSIEYLPDFSRLLTLVASRTAHLINFSDISREIGLPLTTIKRYMNLLQLTYQIFFLTPYFTNVGKRLVKAPKLYFADTGMSCYLNSIEDWETIERQERVGALVETWVAGELRKLVALTARRTQLFFWRTHTGSEVDFLIEQGNKMIAIEVKWSQQIKDDDVKKLHECSSVLKGKISMSVLLYSGRDVLAIDPHTIAIPFRIFFGIGQK